MLARTLAALLAFCCGAHAGAQSKGADAGNYPIRPIRLIIPFPPGGSNDILGRIVAQRLSERYGQQVVIDNRAGADGIIGAELVARAAADGYSLLLISTSYAINPSTNRVPYDPVKDFSAVSLMGSGPTVISAHPSFAARTIPELLALAKAKPGEIPYASSGTGGVIHLTGELFNMMAGVKLLHVPYKGGGPAAIDVVAGQVPLLVSTVASALTQLKSGKLRAVGVGSLKRSQLLPDTPTIAESGVPGFDANVWWGILGPARMPAAIVNKLNADIARIVDSADTRDRIVAAGIEEPSHAGPQVFGKMVADEVAKWTRVSRTAGLKPPQ